MAWHADLSAAEPMPFPAPSPYPAPPAPAGPYAVPPGGYFTPGVVQHPYPYAPPMYTQPSIPYAASDGILHTAHSTEHEEWEPSPLERVLTDVTRHAWIRLEYLLWEIDAPGDKLLGAPVAGIRNPSNYFSVVDPSTGTTIGMARVPTLDSISMRDRNGVRGTLGIPTHWGDVEAAWWTLDNGRDSFFAPELPSIPQNVNDPNSPLPIFIATSTLVNGQLSTNLELYDESFFASYNTKVWGAEAKFVFNTDHGGEWFTWQPMIGFNYLDVQEELRQVGVFSGRGLTGNPQPLIDPLVSEIDADTKNHIYGGLLGLRLELSHPWVTLGFEPKVTLGADRFHGRVRTNNFRSLGDGEVITEDSGTFFSPVVELAIYLRLNVHERVQLHVGYNLLWAARITRPADNIFYNDPGNPFDPPGIVQRTAHEDLVLEGLTLGGVIYLH